MKRPIIAIDGPSGAGKGTVARQVAAALGYRHIDTGAMYRAVGWKALRGSMGSALRLPIIRHRDGAAAADEARRLGCRVVAMAPRGGRSLFDVDLTAWVAVLIGGEGEGLTPSLLEAADERVTIPMHAPVESLNAAVTAALVVYEARRQRRT